MTRKRKLFILIVFVTTAAVISAAILFTQNQKSQITEENEQQNKFLVSVYGKDFSTLIGSELEVGPWENVTFRDVRINTSDDLEFIALMIIKQGDDNTTETVVYDAVKYMFNTFDQTHVLTAFRNDCPIQLIFKDRG